MPEKFRKKPVVIEAEQWDGSAHHAALLVDWIHRHGGRATHAGSVEYSGSSHAPGATFPGSITIETLEGSMTASPSDWIIRGLRGEFYPCKPDVFKRSYELPDSAPRSRPIFDVLLLGVASLAAATVTGVTVGVGDWGEAVAWALVTSALFTWGAVKVAAR